MDHAQKMVDNIKSEGSLQVIEQDTDRGAKGSQERIQEIAQQESD